MLTYFLIWKNPLFLFFRYYVIVHPLKAQYLCTSSKAKKTVVVTWFLAFLLALPITLVQVSFKSTMLQKLSKCEVKAWLSWNLILLPPLRFCVTSNLKNTNCPKMLFLAILGVLNFDFSKFEQLSSPFTKFKVLSFQNCQKSHF